MLPSPFLSAFLVFSEVLGQGVPLPTALACCMTAAALVAILALLRALNIILALVPNTVGMEGGGAEINPGPGPGPFVTSQL